MFKKSSKYIFGGIILADIIKNNPYYIAYKNAVKTGKYLAALIHNLEIFGDCTINFIGFSLGTVVVMTCIQELHKYKDYGRLQDVLLMGGAMNLNDINPDSLKIIAGRIINCYSKNDYILKYLL